MAVCISLQNVDEAVRVIIQNMDFAEQYADQCTVIDVKNRSYVFTKTAHGLQIRGAAGRQESVLLILKNKCQWIYDRKCLDDLEVIIEVSKRILQKV
jgi:hypothetical protein